MSSLRSGPAGAGPALVVRTRQSDHRLQAGTDYRLGRDPASDIVLTDARVSWSHAVFRHEQDVWILEDTGSTNGTFVDTRRVDRITISSECVIRLGDADDGPVLRCEPVGQPVHAPTQVSAPSAGLTTVLVDPPAPVQEPVQADAAPARDDLGTVRENPAPARPPAGPPRAALPPRSPAPPSSGAAVASSRPFVRPLGAALRPFRRRPQRDAQRGRTPGRPAGPGRLTAQRGPAADRGAAVAHVADAYRPDRRQ